MSYLLLSIMLTCAIWFVVSSILIYEYLHSRGHKVSFLFLRFYIPKYVGTYRDVSRSEEGKTGALFYHWLVSINLALVAFLFMLFLWE